MFIGLQQLPAGAMPFLLVGSLLVVFAGLASVARALRRMTMPLTRVMEAAGQVEAGDYTTRVAEVGPPEMRALARAFNAMTARLQSDEAQRRQLLADVTHELRTPLTIVQGNLEGLLDGIYPADAAHLTPILEETRVLARLVDDLRTLAQAEGGTLQLHPEGLEVGVWLTEVVAAFEAAAAQGGVTLALTLPPTLPSVEADPERLREVLGNLLSNALRHTPPKGRIEIAATATPPHLIITVRDTGAGIAPADLAHIFDRFYKSEQSRGMGLGLAIAKNLVEAHGGTLTATSELGQGTTMQIALPLPGTDFSDLENKGKS